MTGIYVNDISHATGEKIFAIKPAAKPASLKI